MTASHPKDLFLSLNPQAALEERWPKPSDEFWKYTKLNLFYNQKFSYSESESIEDLPIFAEKIQRYICGSQNCVPVFLFNGRLDFNFNAPALQRLRQLGVEVVERPTETRFAAGQRMQFVNATFNPKELIFAFSAAAAEELIVQLVIVGQSGDASALFPNITVKCDEGAVANVIETHVSLDEGAVLPEWRNVDFKIELAKGAKHSHVIDQRLNQATFLFHSLNLIVGHAATSEVLTHCAGGNFSRFDLSAEVSESGSTKLFGITTLRAQQKTYHRTEVKHLEMNGISEQLYKNVLDGQSQAAFVGGIKIFPDAQKVHSQQYTKSLLLSREAEADAKPSLEIAADDVKANHGATVGRLDDAQIFYLQSRGINKEAAANMVAQGFLLEVAEKLQQKELSSFVVARLRDGELKSDKP